MTTGLQTTQSNSRFLVVRLVEGATAATGKPPEGAAATVCQAVPANTEFFDLRTLPILTSAMLKNCGIRIWNTAGTNPVSVTFARVWLYFADIGKAFPYGVGADADKGKLNDTTMAMGETDTDKVRHFEVLPDLGLADGIQVEIGVTAGTGSEAFNVDLLVPVTSES